ncbi:ABC transporter permease [Comamonas composti]|uniref:ABC transporter permease n=1 Tax=Comamonas composti TaxID=408558 RepID=UPI000401A8C4|nr:ABC transporter permease subunit [Comamonas composti]
MSWDVIFEPQHLLMYGQGLLTTLSLLLSSLVAGGVLALLVALGLTSGNWLLERLLGSFTYFVRGTPLLIQVYLIYYGLAQLEWIQARWDQIWPWTYFKQPFFCALLAFALNTAGYTAEIVAGAIRETAQGEVEAARAMGMGRWKIMARVVLPGALRRSLPPYCNEAVMLLHATTLASAVPALTDITAVASRIYSDFYLPFEAYLAAAVLYLCVTFALIGCFRLLEKHFLAYLVPRTH